VAGFNGRLAARNPSPLGFQALARPSADVGLTKKLWSGCH